MSHPPSRAGGAVLLTALLLVLLLASLTLTLHLQVMRQLELSSRTEARLLALVQAQNGVEWARVLLPHLELDTLLSGPDGLPCANSSPQWRNPWPFPQALLEDPARWLPDCDDGLPFWEGRLLLPPPSPHQEAGRFLVRFSNNPEEDPFQDRDRIVLLRSMGVVPLASPSPWLPRVHNAVALLEARLRQEQALAPPAPLTLMGSAGTFHWEGEGFLIRGSENTPAVALLEFPHPGLEGDVKESLSPAQAERLQGSGPAPSLENLTSSFREDPDRRRVFTPLFWEHLLNQLPSFADPAEGSLIFLPAGGRLRGEVRGLVFAQGETLLEDSASLQGLLVHLGGGRLRLAAGTRIQGGVWMGQAGSGSQEVQLSMGEQASILWNPSLVAAALAALPPTQLSWRLIFPEMLQ